MFCPIAAISGALRDIVQLAHGTVDILMLNWMGLCV